jgi:hypothetical protein
VIVSLVVIRNIPENFQLIFFSSLAAVTSLVFFRHSRSLWITLDFWINPWRPRVGTDGRRAAEHDGELD